MEINEIIEVECTNCNKKICLQKNYIRENNFCTLWCMDSYAKKNSNEGVVMEA
jgi:hypothetical protein